LAEDDLTEIDTGGRALHAARPSAEAALHASLYRLFARAQAVLHVHSAASITLTRLKPRGSDVVLEGYEMLKALPGVTTHDARVLIPVFDNSQDIPALARAVEARLETLEPAPSALLLRAHGMYAWGATVEEAEHVVEALELMMTCELEMLRVGPRT
jgi:methylthioribulose-1-phosphate dehydratase